MHSMPASASIRSGVVGLDQLDGVIAIPGRMVDAAGGHPFVEKRVHVGGQILDHRQVSQGRNGENVVLDHLLDVGAAGPTRHAVDHHGAGAAHADAAGIAVGTGVGSAYCWIQATTSRMVWLSCIGTRTAQTFPCCPNSTPYIDMEVL